MSGCNSQNTTPSLSGAKFPDISNKKIVMGFWHNWNESEYSGSGYQQGFFKNLQLTDIPDACNVVAVAFMKVTAAAARNGERIPDFKPSVMSDSDFQHQVGILNAQGRVVLISLGGADAHIELITGDEQPLADKIIQLTETYGFDGLDIDLEQNAITARDNQTVIPAALKIVKEHYRLKNKNFIISMAPEFPYLRKGNSYEPYITSLNGYYDFIAPQYYNQGGDGIWDPVTSSWIPQNDDTRKEHFLYALTHAIVSDNAEWITIPADKFVIGLPANNDAAATGYVINPQDVTNALSRLEQDGYAVKGLMTWSVNWDAGRTKAGHEYNWEFIERYGWISGGETPPSDNPSVPAGLQASGTTQNTITLQWQAASGPQPVDKYILYRDNVALPALITELSWRDSGLIPGTLYWYQIQAQDRAGNLSALSAAISVSTDDSEVIPADWQAGHWYDDDDRVSFQETTYICVMQHTAKTNWTPDKADSLWQPV
ncbi:glycosyl hydrolase family 18 protein [Enterobacter mori]